MTQDKLEALAKKWKLRLANDVGLDCSFFAYQEGDLSKRKLCELIGDAIAEELTSQPKAVSDWEEKVIKEFDKEITEEESAIAGERLSGNVVKEASYKGIKCGLEIGKRIALEHIRTLLTVSPKVGVLDKNKILKFLLKQLPKEFPVAEHLDTLMRISEELCDKQPELTKEG